MLLEEYTETLRGERSSGRGGVAAVLPSCSTVAVVGWCQVSQSEGPEVRPGPEPVSVHALAVAGRAVVQEGSHILWFNSRCVHTPNTAFRHLPPNSARFSYATEGALFISAAQLSTDAVSALRKVRVPMEAT